MVRHLFAWFANMVSDFGKLSNPRFLLSHQFQRTMRKNYEDSHLFVSPCTILALTRREKENKDQKSLTAQDEVTEFLLYTAPGGGVKVEVIPNNETIWLTQQRMAELFGVQRPAITKHLKNVYESGELDENSTSSILEHMRETGQIC